MNTGNEPSGGIRDAGALVASLSGEDRVRLTTRLRDLSRLKPYRFFGDLVLDWMVIALAWYVGRAGTGAVVYLIVVVVIASRQHALAVLMHDVCHGRLLRNQKAAEWVSDLFLAFPLFIRTAQFRLTHLAHHRYLNSDWDPDLAVKRMSPGDWTFPMSRPRLCILLCRDLLGNGLIQNFRRILRFSGMSGGLKAPAGTSAKLMRVAYYVLAVFAITRAGLWLEFLVFWLVPMMTVLPFTLRLRSIADHFGLVDDRSELTSARNMLLPWWERFLIAPHNISVHLVHHLFPSIPYHNLLDAHRFLGTLELYERQAPSSRTFFGFGRGSLLRDLVARKET